jgi:hypothetical protein
MARKIAFRFLNRVKLITKGAMEAAEYEQHIHDTKDVDKLYWQGHLDAMRDIQYVHEDILADAIDEHMAGAQREAWNDQKIRHSACLAEKRELHSEVKALKEALARCQGIGTVAK